MRDMPTSTRIAIATLYIRLRNARRYSATSRLRLGSESIGANKARSEEIATWNDFQAVKTNVYADLRGDRTKQDPKRFLGLVALRARALDKAA